MYTIHSIQKYEFGIIKGIILDGALVSNQYEISKGDKFMVVDNHDFLAPKFLSYAGQRITCLPVHFESLFGMGSDSMGHVYVPIDTRLCADEGRDKNISCDLVEGMGVIKLNDWVELMPEEIQERHYLLTQDMNRLHDDVKRERYKRVE